MQLDGLLPIIYGCSAIHFYDIFTTWGWYTEI